MKFWTKFRPGQRVEASDASQVAIDTPVQSMTAVTNDVLVGPEHPNRSYVLSGFDVTNPSGTIIQINGGTAVLGYRKDGKAKFGMVTNNGASSRQVDVSTLALTTTFGIYIRFEFLDDQFANRFFWNPLASTPAETARNVPTRAAENWAFAISTTSPGAEWLQIATFQRNGVGNLVASDGFSAFPTDTREYLFDHSGAIVDADWGASADRTTPSGGPRQAVLGLQRQVQDIIGASSGTWRSAIPANLTTGFLRVDGSNTMQGNLQFDNVGTRSVGTITTYLANVFSKQYYGVNDYSTNAGAATPVFRSYFGDSSTSGPARVLLHQYEGIDSGGSTTNNEKIRLYAVGNSPHGGVYDDSFELAINCAFDPATGNWTRDSTTDAALFVYSKGLTSSDVVRVLTHSAATAATWTDSVSAGNWVESLGVTAAGSVRASSVSVSSGAGTAALTSPLVPIGWGHLITDSSGGLATTTVEGCSAAISGTGCLVTMSTTFANANDYAVVVSSANANITMFAGSRTTSTFLIEADDASGTNVDISNTTGLMIDFVIYGRRP